MTFYAKTGYGHNKLGIISKFRATVIGFAAIAGLFSAGVAQAAGSVNWTSPPNNSSFPVGTVVTPDGIASATGTTGNGLDLVLVLDGSGSMNNTTLGAQADAANALIAAVPQATSRIGIVAFGSSAQVRAPLQSATNQTVLTTAVNGVDDNLGSTNTAGAITTAAGLLTADDNGASKQMVVISDGGPNSQSAAETAASDANAGDPNNGIPSVQVNTVGLPNTSFGNQQDIAAEGGGTFVTATDTQALIDLFNGTAGNLVGISQIDVMLPDGTLLSDIGLTSGIGTFLVPQGYALEEGANTWKVTAFFDDQTSATANLTVFGTTAVIPLPAAGWLMLACLGALGVMRRRRT